jgi:hypothetical protein
MTAYALTVCADHEIAPPVSVRIWNPGYGLTELALPPFIRGDEFEEWRSIGPTEEVGPTIFFVFVGRPDEEIAPTIPVDIGESRDG